MRERPYRCEKCNNFFLYPGENYKADGTREKVCPFCGNVSYNHLTPRSFADKIFKCTNCGEEFQEPESEMTTMKAVIFRCPYCGHHGLDLMQKNSF